MAGPEDSAAASNNEENPPDDSNHPEESPTMTTHNKNLSTKTFPFRRIDKHTLDIIKAEVEALKTLNHKNLIVFQAFIDKPGNYALVTDKFEGSHTLWNHIHLRKR